MKHKFIFSSETKSLYSVGELPPLGYVPQKMYAWVIREETLGNTETAFKEEIVDIPAVRDKEVLIANVAAGLNYNSIWAAKGTPLNVVKNNGMYDYEKKDFHICGSECCGIVYAIGKKVTNVKIGDYVCVNCSRYDPDCEMIKAGICEPQYSPTAHIWGYESNWGSFSQFSKVYDYQCLKKPENFSFEEAATALGTGATVYRMLNGWQGNKIKKGNSVLVWGGSGGLGSYAVKLIKAFGGKSVVVVSDDEKGNYCVANGAQGYINRRKFNHWGTVENLSADEYCRWLVSATKFRNQLNSILKDKKGPDIVIEHPGSDTIATSLLVCAPKGMVVLCGATSGYIGTIDLRYLWIYQKRIQGSHSATVDDCKEFLEFSALHNIKPDIYKAFNWNELPKAHKVLEDGKNVRGQIVIKIVDENQKGRS